MIQLFHAQKQKIITIPIKNEPASMSNTLLYKLAKKNNYDSKKAESFEEALRYISSKEEKVICVFGSLYLCGNILNKN